MIVKVNVMECGNCAAPVELHSRRCEYCGYYFIEKGQETSVPPGNQKFTNFKKYRVAIRFSSNSCIPVDNLEYTITNNRMIMYDNYFNKHLGPPVPNSICGTFVVTGDGTLLETMRRACSVKNLFDIAYTGDENFDIFNECFVESMSVTSEGYLYKIKALFRKYKNIVKGE